MKSFPVYYSYLNKNVAKINNFLDREKLKIQNIDI